MQPLPAPGVSYAPPFSAVPVEDLIQLRLEAQTRELRDLERSGRPEHYVLRRVSGFVAIGVGAGTVVVASMIGLLSGGFGPHSGTSTLSDGEKGAVVGAIAAGLASTGIGIWAVVSAKQDNIHRDRITQLRAEHTLTKRQLKEVRRERKRALRFGLLPQLGDRGQTALLRLSLTL